MIMSSKTIKIFKVLTMAALMYFLLGFTLCSRTYGPSIKISEKSNNYYMDPYGIYFCKNHDMIDENCRYWHYNVFRLKDADLFSFEVINDIYSKDKQNVYYKDDIIKDADASSFEVINDIYSKDKLNVYYKRDIITDADASSFEVINDIYSKDKNHKYYQNGILLGLDPSSSPIDGLLLTTNGAHLYWHTRYGTSHLLEGISPSSYKVLTEDRENQKFDKFFVKNDSLIYQIENNEYQIEDNEVSRVEGFDPATFEFVGSDVLKDKNRITCNNYEVKADNASVYVVRSEDSEGIPHNNIICDKDWLYHYTLNFDTLICHCKIASYGNKFEAIKGTNKIRCGRKIIIYINHDDYYVGENEPTQTFDESESAVNGNALSWE